MKRLALAVALAGCLALSNCATSSTGTTTVAGISVTDVQNDVAAACSFLPTAASVASIITQAVASGLPELSTAVGIAQGICSALYPTSTPAASLRRRATRRATAPVTGAAFLGVVIQGSSLK